MPAEFPLDLIIKQGSIYQTPARLALIIQRIGTDSAAAGRLKVDNKPTGDIFNTVAPLHVTSSNLLGPLPLGKLYYVVPPETKFEWDGASGSKARLIGQLLKMTPGEALPPAHLDRFNKQIDHYLTYVEGTYSHGTDTDLVADAEVEVVSLTPKTIETYTFAHPVLASIANYTPGEGDLGIRFYLDNSPLDELTEQTKTAGIDILSMPRPPADTTEQIPFSLASRPIVVLGDHTISIRARNVKGAAISPAAGTSLTFTITAIYEFLRKSS